MVAEGTAERLFPEKEPKRFVSTVDEFCRMDGSDPRQRVPHHRIHEASQERMHC